MALFKILKGNEADLPAEKHEGWAYVTEKGNMYVDLSNEKRVKIGNHSDLADYAEKATGDTRSIKDTYLERLELVSSTGASFSFGAKTGSGGNSPNTISIPLASNALAGLVSNLEQTFSGKKIFANGIEISQPNGFDYTGMQEVEEDFFAPIWFSKNQKLGVPVSDGSQFSYNSKDKTLSVRNILLNGLDLRETYLAAVRKKGTVEIETVKGSGATESFQLEFLPLAGGTLTGDLRFADSGDNPVSSGIKWSGGTDSAKIVYSGGNNEGTLILEVGDDGTETIDFRSANNHSMTMIPGRRIFRPGVDNEGSLGESDKKWGAAYINQVHGISDKAISDSLGQDITSTYLKEIVYEDHPEVPKLKSTLGDGQTRKVNLPIASMENAGIITTGSQKIKGAKELVGRLTVISDNGDGLVLKNGTNNSINLKMIKNTGKFWNFLFADDNELKIFGSDNSSNPILSGDMSNNRIKVQSLSVNSDNTAYKFYVNGNTALEGATDIFGKVYIHNNDAAADNKNSGSLIIGDKNNYHVAIDKNQIISRKGDSPSDLHINPTGGKISLGLKGSEVVSYGTIYPSDNNGTTLGKSNKLWSKVYVGSKATHGSVSKPIFWSDGVPTECSFTVESSVKKGLANRLAFFDGNANVGVAHCYADSTRVAINSINSTNLEDSVFYVGGKSIFGDHISIRNLSDTSANRAISYPSNFEPNENRIPTRLTVEGHAVFLSDGEGDVGPLLSLRKYRDTDSADMMEDWSFWFKHSGNLNIHDLAFGLTYSDNNSPKAFLTFDRSNENVKFNSEARFFHRCIIPSWSQTDPLLIKNKKWRAAIEKDSYGVRFISCLPAMLASKTFIQEIVLSDTGVIRIESERGKPFLGQTGLMIFSNGLSNANNIKINILDNCPRISFLDAGDSYGELVYSKYKREGYEKGSFYIVEDRSKVRRILDKDDLENNIFKICPPEYSINSPEAIGFCLFQSDYCCGHSSTNSSEMTVPRENTRWEIFSAGGAQFAIPNGRNIAQDDKSVYFRADYRESWMKLWKEGDSVTSAVWNDYAEAREADSQEPGYVMFENGDDTLSKTIERLQHFAGVVSDTWGFSQGETAKAKTHIAVAGRVLVYPLGDRNRFKPGDCVCAVAGGLVDVMTPEEVQMYPDRIVGTVSCVPEYDEWGGGDRPPVKVNGRIWIKVR